MSAEIKCDGCGKTAPMVHYPSSLTAWEKPPDWYQRQDKDGVQDACSRECVGKISQETGKTGAILPLL